MAPPYRPRMPTLPPTRVPSYWIAELEDALRMVLDSELVTETEVRAMFKRLLPAPAVTAVGGCVSRGTDDD